MKVQGFNHITIKVRDLETSIHFYVDLLNMTLVHRGQSDVYLEWGRAWICLVEKKQNSLQTQDQLGVDHVAFSILEKDFQDAVKALQKANVHIVRGPVQRGQGWSINFLDPDGTEIELHTRILRNE